MAHPIYADIAMSVTELKKDPMSILHEGLGAAVAILNRNEPVFYAVPAKLYEELLSRLEDAELNALMDGRSGEPGIPVQLHDL